MFPWHRLQSSKAQTCFMQSSQPGRRFLCLGMPVFGFLCFCKETPEPVLLVTFAEGALAKAAPGTHDYALLANINIIATMVKKKKKRGYLYTAVVSEFSALALCCSPLQCAKLSAEVRGLKGRANRCSLNWCRAHEHRVRGKGEQQCHGGTLCTEDEILEQTEKQQQSELLCKDFRKS